MDGRLLLPALDKQHGAAVLWLRKLGPVPHYVRTDLHEEVGMSQFRQAVADFIRASNKLLEAKDLSDDEQDSVRDILWQLSVKFPDEGDDAAD